MAKQSMAASDSAGDKPAEGSQVVPAVAALKKQLADQSAAHAREIDSIKRGVPSQEDVAAFVAQQVQAAVAAAMAGRPMPTTNEQQTLEKQLAKLEVERQQREDRETKALADLATGPQLFSVCKQDEPRMLRLVGALDKDHARAKYETFMGIRHSEVPYSITPADKAPLAAPGVNAA